MFRKKHIASFCVIVLSAGIVIGLLVAAKLDMSPKIDAATTNAYDSTPGILLDLESAFIKVAEEFGPAVVSISTVQINKTGGRSYYFGSPFDGGPRNSPFGDDLFDRFFEDFFGELPERERRQMGLGSGFIIDERGYILTNQHVVEDADKITVTLPDGREFDAELKGTDPRSDLAVIKIKAKNLPVIKLGDSDKVKIGQLVVAIGNPFGYVMHSPEPTITTGVISALHRSLPRTTRRDRDYSDLIQTDAAINPGNSGGPLVNLNGEVVGINVAIFSTSGGYQGIGFAIPVNTARRVIDKLIEGKKVLYGWLGVAVQELNEDLSEYFGLSDKKGVLISNVFDDSPAKKAGMESGDVIVEFDGKKIEDLKALLKHVGQAEVGSKAKIVVLRNEKKVTLTVEIGERPSDIAELSQEPEVSEGWRGIKVEDITPELQARFRIDSNEGVVIVDIDPDSSAAESSLRIGDVIKEIGKKSIKNVADFNEVIKKLKGNALIRTNNGFAIIKKK